MSGATESGSLTTGPRIRVARGGRAPLVAVRVWLRSGSRYERRPGEALVAGRLLTEGSRHRDFRQIAEEAEGRGISVASGAGLEVTEVAVDGPAVEWERALEWAAELVRVPAFDPVRFAWVRRQAGAELLAAFDDSAYRTAWAFLDQLYRPHPAGRPRAGDAESLERLTVDGCREHHRAALERGAIVSVAGQIDLEAVEARARALFGDLEVTGSPLPEPPAPEGSGRPRTEIALAPPAEQAHLYLGRRTVRRGDPDLPALALAGVVLGAGDGLAGRIPFRVRERQGLAYSVEVETVAGAGLDPGRLVVYCATSIADIDTAQRAVLEELTRSAGDLAEEEVADAKAYLLGREPFRRETAGQVATLAAEAELYGLPVDDPGWVRGRLEGVERRDVEAVIDRWLAPRQLAITVGAPAPSGRS